MSAVFSPRSDALTPTPLPEGEGLDALKRGSRILAALGLAGWVMQAVAADPLIALSAEQAANLAIRTEHPRNAAAAPLLSASARVVVPPGREFVVSTSQAGLVSRLDVAVGDQVQAGQTLAELASQAYLGLQRDLLLAVNEHQLADAQLARDDKLHQAGAIALRRLQETRLQHAKSAASDSETRQVLNIAGMNEVDISRLVRTQRLSDHMLIKAPMAGMVLERLVNTGQPVDQMTPLFRVADVARLWLEIDVPAERVDQVQVGDRVGIDGESHGARIAAIARQVVKATQTVVARAELDSREHRLFPGQTVGVIIQRGSDAALRLPNAALARHQNGVYVFVKHAQGYTATPVELLGQQDGDSVVRAPLNLSDDVAVQGVAALKAKWTEDHSEGGE